MIKKVFLRAAISITLGAFAASGCASKTPRPEPAKLQSVEVIQEAKVRWSADAGDSSIRDAVKLSPYVTEEFLFSVDAKGLVSAFEVESGDLSWTTELGKNVTAGVGGDDKSLFVATANGEVFAISQLHGGTLWSSDVSSEVIAAPVAGRDYVVVRSIDGKVYALDKNSGVRRWIYTYSVPALSIHGNGRPLVVADGVLVGLDNGRLVALQQSDGQVVWEIELGNGSGRSEVEKLNDLDADIQIIEPYIYAVNYQGSLAQINPSIGQTTWTAEVSSVAGLTATQSLVFVTDEFDVVHAFNRDNGEPLWAQDSLSNRRLTGPVVYKTGTVIVGDVEGYLHILSIEDGSIIGRVKTGIGEIAGRPVLRDDTVYVQGRSGRIAAVQL